MKNLHIVTWSFRLFLLLASMYQAYVVIILGNYATTFFEAASNAILVPLGVLGWIAAFVALCLGICYLIALPIHLTKQ